MVSSRQGRRRLYRQPPVSFVRSFVSSCFILHDHARRRRRLVGLSLSTLPDNRLHPCGTFLPKRFPYPEYPIRFYLGIYFASGICRTVACITTVRSDTLRQAYTQSSFAEMSASATYSLPDQPHFSVRPRVFNLTTVQTPHIALRPIFEGDFSTHRSFLSASLTVVTDTHRQTTLGPDFRSNIARIYAPSACSAAQ